MRLAWHAAPQGAVHRLGGEGAVGLTSTGYSVRKHSKLTAVERAVADLARRLGWARR